MTTLQKTLYNTLLTERDTIERQLADKTLPHSDQPLLVEAWEDVTERIHDMEEWMDDWRDAQEEEESRPATPVPESPVRLAPGPPVKAPRPISVTHETGLSRSGKLMTKMPDGRWVPAPPLPFSRPLSIQIPQGMGSPTLAPPPPRPAPAAAARICNCDSDGECSYCEEERWNAVPDDRSGCAHCPGCHYCAEERYDGADEV